jgi:hypothetical protein
MTEQPPDDRDPPGTVDVDAGTPGWVKAFGVVAILFLLAFVALHLAGGGFGHHIAEHMR